MTSEQSHDAPDSGEPDQQKGHRVLVGDQQCPRCQKFFTMSYWSGQALVQARCLSCDLKWPRPDVV